VEGRRGWRWWAAAVAVAVPHATARARHSGDTHQHTKKTKPDFGSCWQIAHMLRGPTVLENLSLSVTTTEVKQTEDVFLEWLF
jgi:hypothetical protein